MKTQQKKGFVLRDYIVAAIAFSAVIALVVLAVADMANIYDRESMIDDSFADTYDKFDEQTAAAQAIYDDVRDKKGLNLVGSFDVLFNSAFTVIELTFNSVVVFGEQITSLGTTFGLSDEVSRIIFIFFSVALTVLIAFIVLSSVSRRDI